MTYAKTAQPLSFYWRSRPLACYCGAREGLHRWGDEACPNPRWKPGNGQSQWMTTSKFSPRAAAVSPLHNP